MLLAFLVSMMMGSFDPSVLTVPIVHAEELWTQKMVKEFARKTAKEFNLNAQHFLYTLKCENNFYPTGQSEHIKNGVREDSWGAVQIHLPSHPTIKREQAENPEFAIRWMAEQWDKDRAWLWSCWKLYESVGWPSSSL